MKLSVGAAAITVAIMWGGAIFLIGAIDLFAPGYGDAVLSLVASVYPGYAHNGTLADLLVGGTWAFLDGLVGGFLFALLYNVIAGIGRGRRAPQRSIPPAPTLAAEPSGTAPTDAPEGGDSGQ